MSEQDEKPLASTPAIKNSKRLFFALWPDDVVVKKIKQHVLKYVMDCQGKIVKQHNWHITLAYFGSADADTQSCLEAHAEKITAQPFELNLTKCGFWQRPKVAWLAPADIPDALQQLVHELQHEITACGFTIEERDYSPHLTLVKKAKSTPALEKVSPIKMKVSSFCLVESNTSPDGAEYKVIKQWEL